VAQVLRLDEATALLKVIKRAHRCTKESAMDWDLLLVTGALTRPDLAESNAAQAV
jgi:hypothetical protein